MSIQARIAALNKTAGRRRSLKSAPVLPRGDLSKAGYVRRNAGDGGPLSNVFFRRYAALYTDAKLCFYEDDARERQKGSVDLPPGTKSAVSENFCVLDIPADGGGSRKLKLQALTAEEAVSWHEAVQTVLSRSAFKGWLEEDAPPTDTPKEAADTPTVIVDTPSDVVSAPGADAADTPVLVETPVESASEAPPTVAVDSPSEAAAPSEPTRRGSSFWKVEVHSAPKAMGGVELGGADEEAPPLMKALSSAAQAVGDWMANAGRVLGGESTASLESEFCEGDILSMSDEEDLAEEVEAAEAQRAAADAVDAAAEAQQALAEEAKQAKAATAAAMREEAEAEKEAKEAEARLERESAAVNEADARARADARAAARARARAAKKARAAAEAEEREARAAERAAALADEWARAEAKAAAKAREKAHRRREARAAAAAKAKARQARAVERESVASAARRTAAEEASARTSAQSSGSSPKSTAEMARTAKQTNNPFSMLVGQFSSKSVVGEDSSK